MCYDMNKLAYSGLAVYNESSKIIRHFEWQKSFIQTRNTQMWTNITLQSAQTKATAAVSVSYEFEFSNISHETTSPKGDFQEGSHGQKGTVLL
jgi:hypothetical protein